jgi:hypothetical protein
MKIAYVVSSLKISMTFVVNELEAHEKAGWQVLPLVSCKPDSFENLWHGLHVARPSGPSSRAGCPCHKMVVPQMVKWNKRAVHRPGIFVQIWATLGEIITHPLRFAKVLIWLITLLTHSPLEFAKAIYELSVCCYFANKCRGFGAKHIHVHFASRSLSLGLMMGIFTDLPVSCSVHAFDVFTRSPGSLRMRLAKCKFIASVSNLISNIFAKAAATM